MAKMLILSLLRTGFSGEIIAFRNSETPWFGIPRPRIKEIFIETSEIQDLADYATRFKARARSHVDSDRYANIMFIDCDCLALRNLDHLFEGGNTVIHYSSEPGHAIGNPQFNAYLSESEMQLQRDGANSGIWMIKAAEFADIMSRWQQIDGQTPERARTCWDQPAWNRLLLELGDKARPIADGEIRYPMAFHTNYEDYSQGTLLHFCAGVSAEMKMRFQFGVFCQRFLGNHAPALLNILD